MEYTVAIKSSAKELKRSTPERFAADLAKDYGNGHNRCEWLAANPLGHPYFDTDNKFDPSGDVAFEDACAAALAACREGISVFFSDRDDFRPGDVIYATAHGPAKISIRAFVPQYRMRNNEIKSRLSRLHLTDKKGGPFDPVPYGKNQKLRCVGSIKGPDDRRVLRLMDLEPTPDNLFRTLIQSAADEPIIVESQQRTIENSIPSRRAAPSSTAAASTSTAVVPAPKRQRGRPRNEDRPPTHLLDALVDKGFLNIRSTKAVERGWTFDCDNHDDAHPCPCCTGVHTSNQFYINDTGRDSFLIANFSEACTKISVRKENVEVIPAATGDVHSAFQELQLSMSGPQVFPGINGDVHYHTYMVSGSQDQCVACNGHHGGPHDYRVSESLKNQCWSVQHVRSQESCPGRIFWHNQYLATYLSPIMAEPKGEAHFADLFMMGHKDILFGDKDGSDVKYFDFRWQNLSPAQLEQLVSSWLRALLRQSVRLPIFENHKGLAVAHQHLQRGASIKSITSLVRSRLAAGDKPDFDANPYLLGADDRIIDMSSDDIIFRQPCPDDFISQSVGYSVSDMQPSHIREIDDIMSRIYPIPEEKDIMQAFAAYCLMGHIDTKCFMALTDRRSGFNGKTTVVAMFKLAMGGYATQGKEAFLLATHQVQNMNQHDSGWLTYKGKRLSVFEELSNSHRLDMGRLKDVTGGGTTIPVRKAHSSETEQMPWTSKIILAFNQGSMPTFDSDDGAFARRMLVMQHRSAFLNAEQLQLTDVPYTYLADTGLMTRLKSAPHKILGWMLEGVKSYKSGRLEQIPQAMLDWRVTPAAEQDEVLEWLQSHIHRSEEEYVKLNDLWGAFQRRPVRGGRVLKRKFEEKARNLMEQGGGRHWQHKRVPPDGKLETNLVTGYATLL